MEYNHKRLFIIISIIIGLILAVLLFWLFYKKTVNNNLPNNLVSDGNLPAVSATTPSSPQTAVAPVAVPPVVKVPPAEFNVEQLAKIFVERLLSYSNQNNNTHITDVLPLVTDKMAVWVNKQSLSYNPEYQGVNTRVSASSIKEIKDSSAIILVDIQQVFEGKEVKVEYKSGRVELVKINNEWKINGLFWN